ncbi:unnamed protein product [Angiostrongylus costaricensis]|uniref:Transposase n=1 Tax=Angiostrongylus costaricensis TaxID=334426 RepID=A0A0R3PLH9_ANGCS|nr:unnamed protein product [Angiostrongylus costaricensis]
MHSSNLRNLSHLRDPEEYTLITKHKWAAHIIRRADDGWPKRTVKCIPRERKRRFGRPPKRWTDVFVANGTYSLMGTISGLRNGHRECHHIRSRPPPWMIMVR